MWGATVMLSGALSLSDGKTSAVSGAALVDMVEAVQDRTRVNQTRRRMRPRFRGLEPQGAMWPLLIVGGDELAQERRQMTPG